MLRAASWTAGLLAVGYAICQAFPQTWVEPLVLLGLGTTLLVVSSRGRAGPETREPVSGDPKEAA